MKPLRLTALLLCLTLLSGCTPQSPVSLPPATLPAIPDPAAAPIGDAGLDHEALTPLYLPSLDGQQLLAFYQPLMLTYSRHPAESIVRALLAHPGNDRVRALSGGITLALSGSDPVVVSGGVCTVDLTPSALQLSTEDFHTVCMALAATLCQREDIKAVNVLIAGQAPPMDVSGVLPLGTVTAQPGQELPILFEQLTARRVPVGTAPSTVPLSAAATLYFPLAGGTGVVPEMRHLSFPGQHPQQLVLTLMAAMADGPQALSGVADMPDFSALLLSSPKMTDLDTGGKQLTLHFVPDIRQQITDCGADPACAFASLVLTLTTFMPSLQQVCIRIGDGALTSLHSTAHGSLLFPGGVQHRADYAGYVVAQSPLWQRSAAGLARTAAALPYRQACDPRALLLALSRLPEDAAVLPAGLTDADILGFAIQGDTLRIHLSDRYAALIKDSGMDQRLMAYAIVGTMCDSLPVRRIRFYFGNQPAGDLGSNVLWQGEFLHNPGLLKESAPLGGTL